MSIDYGDRRVGIALSDPMHTISYPLCVINHTSQNHLINDILNKEEEELSAKIGDKVISYDDTAPIDTVLGVEIFPIIHIKTQEKIYVSLEDIK